ncbi:MAG: uroporphyrinogen decarboxylase [Sporichthyaceae bacterium]
MGEPAVASASATVKNASPGTDPRSSAFARACRREPVPHTPVWFMRQAGRSLPEYRALRADVGMLESCMNPELIVEITLQPVRRYGVDAAIFFSDIVVPLRAAGVELDIVAGVGPVIAHPIRDWADLDQLQPLEPAAVHYVDAAVRMLVAELGPTPLIGFAGAPFTLASYLVEGGPSKTHEATKAMMLGRPDLWAALVARLSQITSTFLRVQAEAGASALQLFDSWAGVLTPADYVRGAMPASAAVFAAIADTGVPRIHMGVGTGELLTLMGEAGADVVGVDWRVPLSVAAARVGPARALQGNLDPAVLLAGWEPTAAATDAVLAEAAGLPGHIFNLGHGVLPNTDPDILARIVDRVHTSTAR